MQPAQDPNEYFDVVTEDGQPTGVAKRRADVHRDGDWHRAVHVWFYGIDDNGAFLLLNQRGRNKDTWPLALDATVGGHLGAGETVEDAFREVHEEVGVNIDPERFDYLFRRSRSSENLIPGVIDRELQDVYLVRDDRPLAAYAPNFAELEGLVQVPVDAADHLFRGEIESCMGRVLNAETGEVSRHELTTQQLLVRGQDLYFIEVIDAIKQRLP
ncbi:MAG: NUDIX domain-containing protein [Thermomicrobiales bacterium]|nr:NUDIX domain-containing protein [Thermomicrobiales bacterium]